PGELGNDNNGNPRFLTDFKTFSSVNNGSSTDSRVGVAGTVSFHADSTNVLRVTFLANDPLHNNSETLWEVDLTATVDGDGHMTFSVGALGKVARVGDPVPGSG